MEIHEGGAEMFHADGQRDMTNLIVAFRTFASFGYMQEHLHLYNTVISSPPKM